MSSSFSPGIGYGFGARIDTYIFRYVSLESGLLYTITSFTTNFSGSVTAGSNTFAVCGGTTASWANLQIPVQFKVWIHPLFSIGGGFVYDSILGNVRCSASGSFTCNAASVSPSDSGIKSSYINWIATVGTKYHFEDTEFWAFGDLGVSGIPNLVQDATKAGGAQCLLYGRHGVYRGSLRVVLEVNSNGPQRRIDAPLKSLNRVRRCRYGHDPLDRLTMPPPQASWTYKLLLRQGQIPTFRLLGVHYRLISHKDLHKFA